MKKFCLAFIIVIFIAFIGFLLIPKPPLLDGISYSQVVFNRHYKLLRMTLTTDHQYRVYTPLNKISKQLIQATLLQEDRYYHHHIAINPIALFKGFWTTYITRNRRRGGSTITMQVARVRYHLTTKTVFGKIRQIYYAFLLERYYTKKQILGAYLNLAPYGGNIIGVGAASLVYFHKAPNQLTLVQALALAVIPQNPVKRQPMHVKENKILRKARDRLLKRWQERYPVTETQKREFNLPMRVYSRKQLKLK